MAIIYAGGTAKVGAGDIDDEFASAEQNKILRPVTRRQNGYFVAALTIFVVFTAVLVAVRIYYVPSFGRSRAIGPTGSGTDSTDQENEVEQWIEAKVSLGDGPMFEVVEKLQHDPRAFTEGLAYGDGVLYESTGVIGESSIRMLDPDNGEVVDSHRLDRGFFGKGITYVDGRLLQLTLNSKRTGGLVYNATDISSAAKFEFNTTTGEGWGITYDPDANEIVVSDGSDRLLFWDPNTMRQIRAVKVVRNSRSNPADNINELEYYRGRILANVWHHDIILVIHPETGAVEKEYDFSTLYPKEKRHRDGADVLNGISVSDDPNVLYVTGKYWDRMYKVKLLYVLQV